MFSSFRNRFGIPGVISVIALVFAMFGGAYAASNSGDATASAKKAKKGPKGPKGAKGAPGAQGPAGAQGLPGAAGAKGDTGAAGANGKDGKDGQSVSITQLGLGQCENGEAGVKLSVGASNAEVCDGMEGPEGPKGDEGNPWTEFGTLPPGEALTGTFAVDWVVEGQVIVRTGISFPIPLAEELGQADVHGVTSDGKEFGFVEGAPAYVDAVNCLGSASNPIAPPGKLCVYVGAIDGQGPFGPISANFPFIQKPTSLGWGDSEAAGAATSGATLFFLGDGLVGGGGAVGSWAVRAPLTED